MLKLDHLHIWEIFIEIEQIGHLGTAPPVNALVVVADDENLAGVAREHAHPGVLQRVGVLEFVDQQMPPAFAVVGEQAVVSEEQLVRAQQQFGEVDQAGALALFFVGLVNIDQAARQRIAFALEIRRPLAFVLGAIDEPGRLARRKARLVEAERGDRALDQALLVVAVEDLEGLRQPGLAPVLAQQAMSDAVESADRQPARAQQRGAFEQRLCARAHLARGLVGEGDREYRPRRGALDFEQPADAMGEHARLAGAGAGENEVVSERRADRFALGRVEIVEQIRNIHCGNCNGACRNLVSG